MPLLYSPLIHWLVYVAVRLNPFVQFAGIINAILLAVFFLTMFLVTAYFGIMFWEILKPKKIIQNKTLIRTKNLPFVSVQIPTRNELIALRCAQKCLDFDYPKNKFEVIIGDDSNKPEVSREIDFFAKKHPQVKIARRAVNAGFKPGNLNNMVGYSKGEIIVIFDSDFTPNKDFLKRIVTPFVEDKDVSAVQAKWGFNNFGKNYVTIFASTAILVFHYGVLNFVNRFGAANLCGSAEAVKKSTLIELGKWKEGIMTEDVEFSIRMHLNNKKIVYLADLECKGEAPYKISDFFKQQMRWSHGILTAYGSNFKNLIKSNAPLRKKFLCFGNGLSYVLQLFFLLLFFSGILQTLGLESNIGAVKVISGFGIGTIVTAMFISANVLVLVKEKKQNYLAQMIAGVFTIGTATSVFIYTGLAKALFGKKMEWYLLSKPAK